MKLFDTLAERYRRHRAIHKYDRWLRFWLFDSAVFLVKMALVAGVVLAIVSYTPRLPGYISDYIADVRGEPSQSASSQATLAMSSPSGLALVPADPLDMQAKTVIPASLVPDAENSAPPAIKIVTIAVTRANLREGPTTRSTVLGLLRKGSKITLFDMDERWAHVATNDERGISGYVHMSLLEESESQIRQQFASP